MRTEFGTADYPVALALLTESGNKGRLARCIVLAAGGSLERLRELIEIAKRDYRDVIVAGEYAGFEKHLRDLRVSFLVNLPDDAWVGEIAVMAAKHGYRLSKVDSHAATLGPFAYSSDNGEGDAEFSNGASTFVVRKADRQWSIPHGGVNLHRLGLDAPIGDEQQFRDQLNYYLSPLGMDRSFG